MMNRREVLLGMGAACSCALAGASRIALASPGQLALGRQEIEVLCAGANGFLAARSNARIDPAPEAAEIVRRMTQSIGMAVPFTVGKSKVAGGAYAGRRGDELVIVYDRDEYDFENGRFTFGSLFVFAHEIGHHIAHPHIRRGGSTPPKERLADRFAGAALARLGATLDQALVWPRGARVEGTKTHPPRAERIAATEAGWHEAQDQLRWQNRAQCKPGWMGPEVQVGGQTCRIAETCAPQKSVRLACQDFDGRWIWQD